MIRCSVCHRPIRWNGSRWIGEIPGDFDDCAHEGPTALARALEPRQPRTDVQPVLKATTGDEWTQAAGYAAVDARSGGRCEHPDGCYQPAPVHHHIAGRRGADPHHPDNLMALCPRHHLAVHADPRVSYANGTMRKRLGVSS